MYSPLYLNETQRLILSQTEDQLNNSIQCLYKQQYIVFLIQQPHLIGNRNTSVEINNKKISSLAVEIQQDDELSEKSCLH